MDGISIVVPSYDVAVSLLATKYLAASGLICVLWDHMLTFTDEVKYIWIGGRWDYVRVLFLLNRYMNEAGLLYTAYMACIHHWIHRGVLVILLANEQTGYERSARCVGFMTAIATLAVISISTANVFMTLRYYALWDHRRSVIVALWSAFGVSYMTIFVLFILTVSDFHDHAQYSPFLQTCILSNKPMSLVGIWASMLAFDVFTLVLAVAGALERPYRHNVDVIVNFQRDGAIFFHSSDFTAYPQPRIVHSTRSL
ncbi:hypothetical protein EW026_g6124 [Hermanssonia centrifuga]|uniref:DUF6533 domain-containing protein n=1 Tax=Hermanssonia centrifuga TaxID=98765 RepID=A0A4S4KC14_9APHY|nr:hypothetical protein EW026_g6124 [Hermanssonia centrifuga]